MNEVSGILARLGRGLSSPAMALAVVAGLSGFASASHPASAQNLVLDPFFANGLADYQTSGNVGVYQIPDGPNAAGILGPNETANLTGLSFPTPSGVVGTLSQLIATTPATEYLISFSLAFDGNVADSLTVSFGGVNSVLQFPATRGNGNGGNGPSAADLQMFGFMASSGGATTDLSFMTNDGGFIVTGLDVEAAPAPLPGGGALSLGAFCALLAAHRMRRQTKARPG